MEDTDNLSINDIINVVDNNEQIITDISNVKTTDSILDDINKIDENKPNIYYNNINTLTLEYFSNLGAYNRYLNKPKNDNIITNSDRKFYKKRILDSTKKMIKGEFENDLLKDIFNKYIFSLISHFKIMDTTEIIQKPFEINESNAPDILDNSFILINDISLSNPDQLLFKKDNKILTMDNFIKKKVKQREPQSFPLKKNINLREPEFKTKGIKKKTKKENIDNV